MSAPQPNNPLHGVTLQAIVEDLVARRGFPELGTLIKIRCFLDSPSVTSSLKFLRKTTWARTQVEELWVGDQEQIARNRRRNERRAAQRAHKATQSDEDADPVDP